MCKPKECEVCGKTTWAGCGSHVDEVRAQVAPENWCEGHEEEGQFAAKGCGCGHEHGIDKEQGVFNRLFKR